MEVSLAIRLLIMSTPLFVWGSLHAATLDVCRNGASGGSSSLVPVDIAVGTVFADVGPSDPDLQTGQNFLPVRLVTDNSAVVHVTSSCVRVAAHVAYNPRHLPVGPAQKRMYRPASGGAQERLLNALPVDRFS